MAQGSSDNLYGHPTYIVDADPAKGSHTTIAAALTDASSGDSIAVRNGTYTEDLTIPAGLNIYGVGGSESNGSAGIVGKLTATAAGTTVFNNLRFTTNSDVILDITGAAAANPVFNHCSIFLTDGDGITINNSSSSPSFNYCTFHQTAATLDLFNITACSQISFYNCQSFNTQSPGTSTLAAGIFQSKECAWQEQSFTTSGTATIKALESQFQGSQNNIVSITTAGTSAQNTIEGCKFFNGTAASISIGAGTTCTMTTNQVHSTNANPVTGAGTITYGQVEFSSTGNGINTTATTARSLVTGQISFDDGTNYLNTYEEGTWTPTLTGSGAGPDTISYTSRAGRYTRIGNIVHIKGAITINAFTLGAGSGDARITGLPFTSQNAAPETNVGSVLFSGVNYAAGSALTAIVDLNVTYARFGETTSNGVQGTVNIADFATGDLIRFEITYWV